MTPGPPGDRRCRVRTERVFRRGDTVLYGAITVVLLAAMAWLWAAWLALSDWTAQPLVTGLLTLSLLAFSANKLGRWLLLPRMRRPLPAAIRTPWRVAAVTTFVPSAEPIEMLAVTLRALVAMRHPHDTWVLDEGDDDRVKALCRTLGAHHFTRKDRAEYRTADGTFKAGSKHGNYNAWLHAIGYEAYDVVSAFDPDHVAAPGFLTRVLGYFEDPEIGYVQAAPAYYNQQASLIARGAAEETYVYHSCIQMASFSMGYPIVIGSHNTHRVSALREVGGFAAHDADDLLITLHYRTRGWRGVYVPEILARGLTPVDWRGYLGQQRRWARSVIDLKLRRRPASLRRLPPLARAMNLLHGLNYLYRGVGALVLVLALAWALGAGERPRVLAQDLLPPLAALVGAIGLGELFIQRFFLDPRTERGVLWRIAVLHLAKWPHVIRACVDALTGRQHAYVLTAKTRQAGAQWREFGWHLLCAAAMGAAWAIGAWTGAGADPVLTGLLVAFVLAQAALVGTALVEYPAPFDAALLERPPAGTPAEGPSTARPDPAPGAP